MKLAALIALAFAGGCATTTSPDPGLEGLSLSQVAPDTIVPGTSVVLTGASFIDPQWGAATLHLTGAGTAGNGSAGPGSSAEGQSGVIDVQWSATFVDFATMTVAVDPSMIDDVGGTTDFTGTATVEVVAVSDGKTYTSAPLAVSLHFRKQLTPTSGAIAGGVEFVNDQIEVDGDGFLLGGDEGITVARVTGCFTPDAGGSCTPVASQDIPLVALDGQPLTRTQAAFPFAPAIAGIQPGEFTGQVQIVDQQTGQSEVASDPVAIDFTLVTSQIFSVDPPAASLGQFVFVHGGGFVGGADGNGALTEVELDGTFTKDGGAAVQVTMSLIPEFVEGRLVRYIINTDDTLGHALDLRNDTGNFTGTMTPIVSYGADTVRGQGVAAQFALAPVKQVVYLHFQSSYTEELRDFGLRAMDGQIRDEILAACNLAYKGVNIEFRTDPVTDFALFSDVELVGVDPNNMDLFGYDNTPGKDSGNLRLYDELGGANAATQADGFPGFGGVFVRSLMGFSMHPGAFGDSLDGADPAFDAIYDPLREDQGGTAVTSEDLAGGIPELTNGTSCPGTDRTSQIACGVYVMGNLVGGTLAHEIGHSLGLAYPYEDNFHDNGDQPDRLMDAGGDRPFLERAVIGGQGPGVFCDDEYTYLRKVLPSSDPANNITRPTCD
jgi:hypothetical protein